MLELSHFPAPTAGVLGGTVLLLTGSPFGAEAFVLSLTWWLIGQYIAAESEAK